MTDSSDSTAQSGASPSPDEPLLREDVEERRGLLRRILDSIPTAVFIKDRDGRYLLMNRACRDLLGLSYDQDVTGMRVEAFFSPDQSERINELEDRIWEESEALSAENIYETPDGRRLTLLTHKSSARSDGADTGVIFAVATDVTEHTGVEERLAQQAHELRERVKEVSCLYDVSRMLLECDGRITSDVLRDIARRIPAGWQHPEITEVRVRLGNETGATNGFRQTEWTQEREIGSGDALASIEVAYLEDPREDGGTVFLGEEHQLLDSLVQRLAEAGRRARAEAKVRFQANLLDTVGESVIATDVDGRIIYWNHAAEEMYGWSVEDAVGRHILDVTPSDDMREQGEEIMESLARGETWSGEFEVQRRDGSTFVAYVTDAPIFDDDGEVVGIVGVSRDLTRMKQLEARLQQSQRLEALGRLAGGIAHDFNNMLTAIRGNAQLLAIDADDDEEAETIAEIDRAATRAADLTSQLLAFSRRQMLAPRVLSINAVVAEMESMLRRLLGDQVELSFEYEPDAGNVRADPTQLHQLLMNLVVNARDAIAGSGAIAVHIDSTALPADHPLAQEALPPGDYVEIRVADTGEGMDQETLQNIFEPFFTTKPEGAGTGLGLSTVYGIVKQSGGHVDVESTPGEGSTFRILLPRIFEPADSTPSEASMDLSGASDERTVLICEDEETVRRFTRRTLERHGFDVVVAESARHALELFDQIESVDLIISDVVMPEMSGIELLEALRERAPDTRVLLVSGYAKPEVLEGREIELGEAFLHKPFNATELIEKVAEILD